MSLECDDFLANQDSNRMQTRTLRSVSDRAANLQFPVACYANRSSAIAITRIALLTDPTHVGYEILTPVKSVGVCH